VGEGGVEGVGGGVAPFEGAAGVVEAAELDGDLGGGCESRSNIDGWLSARRSVYGKTVGLHVEPFTATGHGAEVSFGNFYRGDNSHKLQCQSRASKCPSYCQPNLAAYDSHFVTL